MNAFNEWEFKILKENGTEKDCEMYLKCLEYSEIEEYKRFYFYCNNTEKKIYVGEMIAKLEELKINGKIIENIEYFKLIIDLEFYCSWNHGNYLLATRLENLLFKNTKGRSSELYKVIISDIGKKMRMYRDSTPKNYIYREFVIRLTNKINKCKLKFRYTYDFRNDLLEMIENLCPERERIIIRNNLITEILL
jgi:hypothetical protein